ncbi:TPA: hypothetical protein HA265_03530 [Candidatus Woesearchaeota archaeon]|nr:hypothetical protein [Candidatus Woesearchaeota archaeon]
MKKAPSIFRNSISPRRIGAVLLWEILFLAATVVGFLVWARAMSAIAPMAEQALGPMQMAQTEFQQVVLMSQAEPTIMKMRQLSYTYTGIGLLYLILIWAFFKAKAYLSVRKQKMGLMMYLKFLGAQLSWLVVLFLAAFGLQKFIYKTLYFKTEYSAAAGYTIMLLAATYLLTMTYLTVTLFSTLARERDYGKALKMYWEIPLKKVGKMLRPIGLMVLIFLAMNLLMFMAKALAFQTLIISVQTILLLLFISWVKVYYSDAMDRLLPEKRQHKTEAETERHAHRAEHKREEKEPGKKVTRKRSKKIVKKKIVTKATEKKAEKAEKEE